MTLQVKQFHRIIGAAAGLLLAVVAGISPATAAPGVAAVPPVDPYPTYVTPACSSFVEQPGVKEFRDLIMSRIGGRNLGIHACSGYEHGEGRAWDWGMNASNSGEAAKVAQVLDWLLRADSAGNPHALARRLGIGYIIWNRQIITLWSSSSNKSWHAYSGSNPHTDHVHFSFGWPGARRQTTWFTTANRPGDWYPSIVAPSSRAAVHPVAYNGEFHVVGAASAGNVIGSWFDGGTWRTQNLGGFIQGSPFVVVYNGEFHIVAANGGQVFHTWYGGGVWQPWGPISTGADPVATVYNRNGVNEFHVTSRAANGSVVDAWYDGVVWRSQNLGGIIQGRPSTAVFNGEFHIVGANGGQVFHTWYGGGGWQAWGPISTGADPVATVYNRNGVNEFHVTSRAANGSVVDAWYDGVVWRSQNLGGIIQGRPSTAVFNGEFHIVGANGGQVFQTWYGGGGWQAWGPISTGADPVATVYNRNGVNEFHIVSRQGNGSVTDAWYDGTWHSQPIVAFP